MQRLVYNKMTQKLLPKQNSVYTNVSANAFLSKTQGNIVASSGISNLGINGGRKLRELPLYNHQKTDKIITKDNSSAFIKICEDAPYGPGTGNAALGTPASGVNITAGLSSGLPEVSRNSSIYVNDNFAHDAAKFYLSETTEIEDIFSMPKGDNTRPQARSGIGMQADNVVIKGRAGLKLSTATYGDRNSKGGKIRSGSGIELIAGTYTANLQPLVLGNNLRKNQAAMLKRINALSDIIVDLAAVSNAALLLIQSHTHTLGIDPVTRLPGTFPSAALLTGLPFVISDNTTKGIINGTANKINLFFDEINYLTSLGNSYISSDLNRTN